MKRNRTFHDLLAIFTVLVVLLASVLHAYAFSTKQERIDAALIVEQPERLSLIMESVMSRT